jgi:hypothetical protein
MDPSDSSGAITMLMILERRAATRPLRGWAVSVLLDAGATRECEEHGWMMDRADPRARDRHSALPARIHYSESLQ